MVKDSVLKTDFHVAFEADVAGRAGLDSPALLPHLRCPLCKGKLTESTGLLSCGACDRNYPVVLGIPDLRVYEDPLIPLQDDYRKGEKVEKQAKTTNFEDLVRYYWSLPTYPPTPDELKERFIHHVLSDELRIESYRGKIGTGGAFLETGCGTAPLMKVVCRDFDLAIGCDVAFRWLLIARKRLQGAGLPANLVCCCADYLPFPPGMFDCAASVSLLEHVANAEAVIAESARVLNENGRVFAWTTNRFSIAAEPHVRVWGVGFLPRKWMPRYVKWQCGLAYEKKKLLSLFEIRRFLRRVELTQVEFSLPVILEADRLRLSRLERIGARVFQLMGQIPAMGRALVIISPVIQLVAKRGRSVDR